MNDHGQLQATALPHEEAHGQREDGDADLAEPVVTVAEHEERDGQHDPHYRGAQPRAEKLHRQPSEGVLLRGALQRCEQQDDDDHRQQ